MATLLHQIDRLREHDDANSHLLERDLASKALDAVRAANMKDISLRNAEGRLSAFEDLIHQIRTCMHNLSDELTADYLTHLTASRLTSSS